MKVNIQRREQAHQHKAPQEAAMGMHQVPYHRSVATTRQEPLSATPF